MNFFKLDKSKSSSIHCTLCKQVYCKVKLSWRDIMVCLNLFSEWIVAFRNFSNTDKIAADRDLLNFKRKESMVSLSFSDFFLGEETARWSINKRLNQEMRWTNRQKKSLFPRVSLFNSLYQKYWIRNDDELQIDRCRGRLSSRIVQLWTRNLFSSTAFFKELRIVEIQSLSISHFL